MSNVCGLNLRSKHKNNSSRLTTTTSSTHPTQPDATGPISNEHTYLPSQPPTINAHPPKPPPLPPTQAPRHTSALLVSQLKCRCALSPRLLLFALLPRLRLLHLFRPPPSPSVSFTFSARPTPTALSPATAFENPCPGTRAPRTGKRGSRLRWGRRMLSVGIICCCGGRFGREERKRRPATFLRRGFCGCCFETGDLEIMRGSLGGRGGMGHSCNHSISCLLIAPSLSILRESISCGANLKTSPPPMREGRGNHSVSR